MAISYPRFKAEIEKLYGPALRRKSTLAKLRTVLREIGDLPGVRRSTDLTIATIAAWLAAHPGRSPMTQRSYLSSLRAACRLGKKAGWLTVNPFELRTISDWVPWYAGSDSEPTSARHLSITELQALLGLVAREARDGGWPERRLQALIYTYVHTGLRKSEALGLRLSDYRRGVIRVQSHSRRWLKTRSSARLVGTPADLGAVLDAWVPCCGSSEWLFPGARRKGPWLNGGPGYRPLDQVKAAGERAGIRGLTIHALRRSIATHARRLGITTEEVQALLGHADVETQEWYLEQDADDARDLARRIRFRSAPPPDDRPSAPPG